MRDCSINTLIDWAVLSYLRGCVRGKYRDVMCDCVYTRTSLCVCRCVLSPASAWICMCVLARGGLRALSVEADHLVMGDRWKIGLFYYFFSLHTLLCMEMSYVLYKQCMPFSEVALQPFVLMDLIVHCNTLRHFMWLKEEERDPGKVLGEQRVSDSRQQLLPSSPHVRTGSVLGGHGLTGGCAWMWLTQIWGE